MNGTGWSMLWLGETQICLDSQPALPHTRSKTTTDLQFCNTKLEKGYTQFRGKKKKMHQTHWKISDENVKLT